MRILTKCHLVGGDQHAIRETIELQWDLGEIRCSDKSRLNRVVIFECTEAHGDCEPRANVDMRQTLSE